MLSHSRIALIALCALGCAGAASASTVTLGSTTYYLKSVSGSGNDCKGALGTPPLCNVFPALGVDSPLIAKYDYVSGTPGSFAYGGTAFPSVIDGSEFTVTFGGSSGTFTYNPGAGDPLLRYWSVKAGPGYTVFWLTLTAGGTAADAVSFPNGDCGGPCTLDWTVPGGKDLSHITFYDTGSYERPPVPLPASVWLLGSALLGMAGIGRRRKTG